MKHLIGLTILMALFLACEKPGEEEQPTTLDIVEYMPLDLSNYWDYRDDDGEENRTQFKDTTTVKGFLVFLPDSNSDQGIGIKGNTLCYFPSVHFYADTAFVLADGDMEQSEVTQHAFTYWNRWDEQMETIDYSITRLADTTITVPAGTFECIRFDNTATSEIACYAKDVGIVKTISTHEVHPGSASVLVEYYVE